MVFNGLFNRFRVVRGAETFRSHALRRKKTRTKEKLSDDFVYDNCCRQTNETLFVPAFSYEYSFVQQRFVFKSQKRHCQQCDRLSVAGNRPLQCNELEFVTILRNRHQIQSDDQLIQGQ